MAQLAIIPSFLVVNADGVLTLSTALAERAWPAALITLIFALLAYRMHAVNTGGAVAGAAVSFALYVSAGPGAFIVLAVVFALTAATTQVRSARKQRLGVAESKHGRRAWQILANLIVPAAMAVLSLFRWHEPLLLAAAAALAEAASDTVSSECGQALASRVYMITSFRRAPVGRDGAISLVGTVTGAAAALLVALIAAWTAMIPRHWIAAAAGAAIFGNLADSVLGATVQRKGWLDNSAVNLLSTAIASAIALLILL